MQNLYSNLTIICCQTLSIGVSQSSKMYTNTTLNKNSAMNIFDFVFPLNQEEKLYIISVNKCGRMSRRNFATVIFNVQKIFQIQYCLQLLYKQIKAVFFYSKFDYYRLCVILTFFFFVWHVFM